MEKRQEAVPILTRLWVKNETLGAMEVKSIGKF